MCAICVFSAPVFAADTNTVSSTVVTDKAPPTANAPSIVVNNSDVCKSAFSAGVQTQILGIASGVTVGVNTNTKNIKKNKLANAQMKSAVGGGDGDEEDKEAAAKQDEEICRKYPESC